MARAWIEIPTVTHHDEADITKLERLRKKYAPRVKEAGGHLTWTAILLNVLAGALKRFPQFNASVDMAQHRIIYKKYVHIGIAVDTERGLLVPVIRDVDAKNVVELATALAEISEAARGRNIKPEMMQGATFTITNLGGIGGVAFSPIVNPPQVAILGVSRGSTRPVWHDDAFEPRQILPLALSYDHRVIDGADAARFLRWVCEALEEPFLLDLEGQ
jgi:pyruvate dehydrogenase E2 component (dihydrolipoamide acetyltransferase)